MTGRLEKPPPRNRERRPGQGAALDQQHQRSTPTDNRTGQPAQLRGRA
jgi:hypothetical protein